ncbi:MAG TPA: ATP-binding protein [Streptosporangiaceae bacterium]|nr:ATP-binding protein [Streptosporangiaceae bacterium]HEX5290847.1 ATP-binding protein [Streptosporangiaceae bacterium]
MSDLGLMRPSAGARHAPTRIDAALDAMLSRLGQALDAVGDEQAARFLRSLVPDPPPAAADGGVLGLPHGDPQPVDRLVTALGLGAGERDLLVLSLAGHCHEGVAAILRGLHPDGMPWPTVGLAATLAERGSLAGLASRAGLREVLSASVLLRCGALIIEGDGPAPERTLRPAPHLWEALTGLGGWPDGARIDPRPAPDWGLDRWRTLPAVRGAHKALAERACVTVLATGHRPAALAGRLAALAHGAGSEPVILRVDTLRESLIAAVLLLAVVRDVVPVLWEAGPQADGLDLLVPDLPMPLVMAVCTAGVTTWPRPLVTVPGGPLDRLDRNAAVRLAVPELSGGDACPGPASSEPRDIAMAARDLRARAALVGPLTADELRREFADTVDTRTAGAVPAGAVLVHPRATWDDLVVPADRRAQLREAVERARAQDLLDRQDLAARHSGSRGLRLLFTGPPGTGKTLAAEVIAAELGRDLLVIDLARLVSKWIGETEKNLAGVFDAAERGDAALFFDEADALFGKRTEVGDARDRYANLETAYLLSRLERFDGIAVLASNLRQNIDSAFGRRIEFIVPFDPPDADQRLRLWQLHLPGWTPLEAGVPLAELAALYEMPGALIRNAAVAAGFLAVTGRGTGEAAITTRHLVHAIRREFAKAGQAFPGLPPGYLAEPPIGKGELR